MQAGVRTSVIVLRALHITIRAILVLACAFWLLIALELIPPLLASGVDGLRGKLMHIWMLGQIGQFESCQNSLQVLHQGYTDLILFLLLTWAALEVKRFLSRRILEQAQLQRPLPH